jgi:hypothetical protein
MNRRTYYDLIRQKIAGAVVEAAVAARSLKDSALAGRIREIALRDCVQPYLTHSFRCGTGKILDTTGHLTKQLDLVVYQTQFAPPLLLGGEIGIFPAECCAYAFEVKSTLTAAEIKRAIDTGRSVRQLRSFPRKNANGEVAYGPAPIMVLFAFGTNMTGDELERYLKYDKSSLPLCNVLMVLGKGYWFWHPDQKQWYGATVDEFDYPEGIFAAFIAGFSNKLVSHEATLKGFSPGEYMCYEDRPLRSFKKVPTPTR